MRISDGRSDVCSSDLVALRVNPDVDAGTHAKITTGRADTKFGIEAAAARDFLLANRSIPGIRVEGLAVHIGSQLTEIAPYRLAFERLIALYKELRAAGVPLKRLDFGGGIGISYRHEPLTGAEHGRAHV